MAQPLFIVDAFATGPFSGNPAAVCLLSAPRPAGWMQQVAAEMNLAETAFAYPQPLTGGEWQLQWFTPVTEVNLCGHATLATAHVLWCERRLDRQQLDFRTRSGLLTARRRGRAIELDFPADPPVQAEPGLYPQITGVLGMQATWLGRGREDIVAVLDSAELVRTLKPDILTLAAMPTRGLIVTAPGDKPDIDFVSRFFAPAAGIDEDPVTGSAHCLLAVYWGQRLGRNALRGCQVSARGGIVEVEWHGTRVALRGLSHTILKGEFYG